MLTPRQWQVAERVARGMSNKAIAQDLGVSVQTVKWHLREAARNVPGDGPQRHRLVVFVLLEADDDCD